MKFLFFLSLTLSALAAEPADVRALLQQGLFEEEGNRDLDKASAAYLKLLAQFDAQRNFAATALFRLAEIRTKQGNKEEAIALHQRVLKEFPGQEPLANLSRDKLAALGGAAPALEQAAMTSKEAEELARVRQMAANSPDLINADNPVDGRPPLVNAALDGRVQVASFLIDHGAKINGADNSGSPLRAAASAGHKKLIELLLARGADINAATSTGTTALHEACEAKRLEVVSLLLEKGAKVNVVANVPAPNGFPDGVIASTPLFLAMREDNSAFATLMLDHGADPNLADPAAGVTPLIQSVSFKSGNVAKLLLERGANPNIATKEGSTALLVACRSRNEQFAKLLLEKKANPNAADAQGVTPLHEAASISLSLVRLLLDAGASPKNAALDGSTPLHRSAAFLPNYINRTGVRQIRSIPASGGASSVRTVRTINALPPPSAAPSPAPSVSAESVAQLIPIWEALLSKGAEINAQMENGVTLLHWICTSPMPEQIAWLIRHGADIAIKDKDNQTAFEWSPLKGRLALEQQFHFPSLASEPAIHTILDASHARLGPAFFRGPTRIARTAEFEAPPQLLEILQEIATNIDVLQVKARVSIHRAGPLGMSLSAPVLELEAATPAPEMPALLWGDIVVIEVGADNPNRGLSEETRSWIQKALAKKSLKITVETDGRAGELTLSSASISGNEPFFWSPTETPLPGWRLSSLVSALTEPRTQLDRIKLQRQVNGKLKEWTIDMRALTPESNDLGPNKVSAGVKQLPVRLAEDDRLLLPLRPASDPEALAARRSTICRTVPGRLFTDQIFTKPKDQEAPRTLGELLVESYARPMLIPAPDLSRIVIHRLKNDSAEEEHIAVDLAQKIRALEPGNLEKARAIDMPLKWGDIVEIPRVAEANLLGWTALDSITREFLHRVLTRTIPITLQGRAAGEKKLNPIFAEFRPQDGAFPVWTFTTTASPLPANFMFSSLALLKSCGIDPKSILRFSINRPGAQKREFNAAQIEALNPWLQLGDSVEIDKL